MSKEVLSALSPWAAVDTSIVTGLALRLDTLEGKTVGMFGDFMMSATYMLQAVEAELRKRYQNISFSYYRYTVETTRIIEDEANVDSFNAWLDGVDCALSFYGAVPSSSLFLGYNSAYMEKAGKPTVMAVKPMTYSAAVRGCKAIGVPGLRTIALPPITDIYGHASGESVIRAMDPVVVGFTDQIVEALTGTLSEEEANPTPPSQAYANDIYTGTAQEISRLFYHNGWTNGQPIEIPTREAVDEMLTGTDLPADYVVGYIPPKMGVATVERIAINAVMAGCLPTYLPVLIAAVQGALDKRIYLEGWTCSQSTWGPTLTISGPVVKDIGLNTGVNALSPYYKANAVIGRAFGYIMMNIGGLRPGIEDLSESGHENRLGLVMGDDMDTNPWCPLHVDFGFAPEDSAVTMFWPQEHHAITGRESIQVFLRDLCKINPYGWEPGLALIFTPTCARMFHEAGWDKQRVLDYIVEYARRPGSEVDIAWLIGNSHPPKTVDVPMDPSHSTRIFWDKEHMFAIVAGGHAGPGITVFAGGGDHGGPSCTRIQLPANWSELVEKYREIKPEYIDY